MTTKAAFNAEEWALIARAPVLVGMLVVAADRGGTVRESVAVSRAYADARDQHQDGLLRELLTTPPAIDPATGPRTPEDLRRDAPETLRRAVSTLAQHATDEEIVAYKRLVFAVADKVARAHREGGFLGIGGTEVSEHEQAALDEVAKVLDET
jgi:hypothetical protein